jgi:hypothetical protein
LQQESDHIRPDKGPNDDSRFHEQAIFAVQPSGKSWEEDVVLGEECTWREQDKL